MDQHINGQKIKLFCVALVALLELPLKALAGRGELYEADSTAPQKNYEEQEDGKLVPHRLVNLSLKFDLKAMKFYFHEIFKK